MCAIFGITNHDEAANLTYLGLHALQHRGQEGAGIVSLAPNSEEPHHHRRLGLVSEIFSPSVLQKLQGNTAIGHTRYSTTGANIARNLQPMVIKSALGWVSVAHNGNLTNAGALSRELEGEGSLFHSTSDTEVIIHLMARSRQKDLPAALVRALKQVEGAYSLLVLSQDYLIAVRDPRGFRPLVMGHLQDSLCFASETSAFDLIGAKYDREIEPGEMVLVPLKNPKAFQSLKPFATAERARCIFEYIYLARPDSFLYGQNVHETRKALGRRLAEEHPVNADVVIPVPDSGVPAAIGFSEQSKIPFDMGIIRSHYIGRTFIEPRQSIRDFGVKLKLNPVKECVLNKRVVVVDDSLVRGTTSRKLVKHLRGAGAREVHVRISAPPTTHSCFYGVDTPTRAELMASDHSIEEIREFIGADTLGYLSLEGLTEVTSQRSGKGFCQACFSGRYPTNISGIES